MRVITEQFLRKLFYTKQLTKGSSYEIDANTKVTPSALAFARENSIVLQRIEEESMDINLKAASKTKGLTLEVKLQVLEKIYEIVLALQDPQVKFDPVLKSDLLSLANRLNKYLSDNKITIERKDLPDLVTYQTTLYALSIALDYEKTRLSLIYVKLMSLYQLVASDKGALIFIIEMLEIVQKELQKVGE